MCIRDRTPGDLIAYLIYTVLIASPVAIMADLYGQFQAAIGASQRLSLIHIS